MKVVEFRDGKYQRVDLPSVFTLHPFDRFSLGEQLKVWHRNFPVQDPPLFLVFTPEEEAAVWRAVQPLANNLGRDRGLGRVDRLDWKLFCWVAQELRWEVVQIPTDGNGRTPITEVQAWSLAIRPLP